MMRAILLAAAVALLCSVAEAAQWNVDSAKSTLGFVVTWDREPFRASFNRWTAGPDNRPCVAQM